MAQRTLTSTSNTVVYLHGDHLGSTLILSRQNGTHAGQWYTPWGDRRTPAALSESSREYTGQKRDDTGLLFYNARYYDPALGRFISPDTIVPGTESGSGGAAATVGNGSTSSLTVDFHEGGFLSQLNGVNAQRMGQGFWFELSGQQRRQAEGPSGPANPQALNRYSYVLNNPLRYTDPTGHCPVCRYAGPIIRGAQAVGRWLGRVFQRVPSSAPARLVPTINFLESQSRRVSHIMDAKHNWDKLVTLTGNHLQDYRAVQNFLTQAMSTVGHEIGKTPQGQRVLEWTINIRGQQVIVRGIELAKDTYQVTDGWVK